MPLKTCRVHHSEAKHKIVEAQVDVEKAFTLDEMKKCHNVRLAEARPVLPGQLGVSEHHAFTPDMLKLFAAWNPKVGWDGFFRLPEMIEWTDTPVPPAPPVADQIQALKAKLAELEKAKAEQDAQQQHNEGQAALRAEEAAAAEKKAAAAAEKKAKAEKADK